MASLLEHTVMPSGGDYTSLDAAIDHLAATHPNLVTSDVYAEIKIDGTWSSADTAAVIIVGLTTDATHYLYVYAASAARHAGVWSTGKYNLTLANGQPLDIREDYVRCDGFQVSVSGVNATSRDVVSFDGYTFTSGANEVWLSNMIIKGADNATYYQRGILNGTNLNLNVWNCIIYGIGAITGSRVITWSGTAGTLNVYSTVGIGGELGLYRGAGTVTAKNCYFGGSSSADYSGTITETNCASEDATSSGTDPHDNVALDTDTFVNVTYATADYHLAADGLSPLQGHGVDTTGDAAPLNFTTDIDGQTRDATWDIGADAWVVAGGATYNESIALSSTPACSHSPQVDFSPFLGAFASTPAAVVTAIADLFVSLALASGPALGAVGGSDFYEALGFSSSPALSGAAFKEAFGELSLLSSPALSASALANLYAAITMASAGGISMTALADLFAGFNLSSIPALSTLGQIGGIFIQKMVMESIGIVEKVLRTKKYEADGDIDIRNLILSNPYDEIAPVSTTWEVAKKIQKDA